METRRFGRTGHDSTVAIFGAVALGQVDQAQADATMEQVIAARINHFDVAPSYGHAEERLGPWMPRLRDQVFLGCKTMERTKAGAAAEFKRSLGLLQVDRFDLYQFHAVTTFEDLDQITAPGGALEAVLEARQAGLTRYIGITGHGMLVSQIFLEALRRFDFDSLLFPINFVLFADTEYRASTIEVLRQCRARDVGTMIIKASAAGPWGDHTHTHHTWYRPFTDLENIQKGINFALSQDVTGICTAGDYRVLPLVLQACENYAPLTPDEQEALIATASAYEPIFES